MAHKKLALSGFITGTLLFCNAQNGTTLSLEQYGTIIYRDLPRPDDLVAVLDLNHTLDKYTGQ